MLIHCTADAEKDADMKRLKSKEAITILKGMKVDIPVPKAAVTQIKRNEAIDMAIDALKAQAERTEERTETHACDCISRQAAIDAFYKHPNIDWTTLDVLAKINALPSAQPEPCEDAVSRQAVYNVLDKMPVRGFKKDGETIHGLISLSQVNSAIIDLPSVQPEIVLCKDCVKRNRKLGSLDEHYNRYNKSQCCPMIEFRGMPQGHEFDYQYCSWAERKTDESD